MIGLLLGILGTQGLTFNLTFLLPPPLRSDFLMEVDEDCSGTIEWEEFARVARMFITRESPCQGLLKKEEEDAPPIPAPRTPRKPAMASIPKKLALGGGSTKVQERFNKQIKDKFGDIPRQELREKMKARFKELNQQGGVPDTHGEQRQQAQKAAGCQQLDLAHHTLSEQPSLGQHPVKRESKERNEARRRFARFWGFGLGSRLFHPVDFRDVGNGGGAATALVRATMQQRFQDVGEALVFFDVDNEGSLTRARFELGLARMGLLQEVNPEQLMCEANGAFNGKLSKLNGDVFLRHFHWGPVAFDMQAGTAMHQRALQNRESVFARGRPSLPKKKAPCPAEASGRQGLIPKPPQTAGYRPGTQLTRDQAVPSERSRTATTVTYKSFADCKKERVDNRCQTSTRLTVMASKYVGLEANASSIHLPHIGRAIDRCTRTCFAVASAFEADEKNSGTINVLRVSTPETPRDGTPSRSSKHGGKALPPHIPKSEEAAKMERFKDNIQISAERGRIARMQFL